MALERLQNGWLISRKENSTMKNVPSKVKVFPVRSLNHCLPDSDAATVLIKVIS